MSYTHISLAKREGLLATLAQEKARRLDTYFIHEAKIKLTEGVLEIVVLLDDLERDLVEGCHEYLQCCTRVENSRPESRSRENIFVSKGLASARNVSLHSSSLVCSR
jgi:hypothetical protein